jgi:diamine N-acetyltransferase
VALGPLRRDLAATYARWINQPEVKRRLMMVGLMTPETEDTYLEETMKAAAGRDPTTAAFTIYDRADDEPIGTSSLMEINWRHRHARFGIFLGERRGQGLGTEATRLVLDWGFNMLGLANVLLEVLTDNERAIRAYERAGFRRLGVRRGAILDAGGTQVDEMLMDAVPADFGESALRAGGL